MPRFFWPLAAALVACRFYAFRPFLDHPHLFRQADTAFYSLGFYRFGMNLFSPSVGWMGSYRRIILEFPLTEWIAAWFYFITGPTILVDRLVNLGFFLGSAVFLFQTVRLVHDRLLAGIVVLLYMAAPLSIYYSRAVHIDFTAVCFSHAQLLYSLRFVNSQRRRDLAAAILTGMLAFVIKAPYAFSLILPALFMCHRRRARARIGAMVVLAYAIPALAFLGWFGYSQGVNRQAPDLSFIPSYFSHVNRFGWYFGAIGDRWNIEPWQTVIGRVHREIASTISWMVLPLGLMARKQLAAYFGFTLSWTAGTAVYLLVFLTLNAAHNYYQIPFIAPFSLWLGGAIYASWTTTGALARWGRPVALIILFAYAASSMLVATNRFYRVDPFHLTVGDFVKARTSEDDLVVMAYTEAEYADPSFLFYARRFGWSVTPAELSPRILRGLEPHGATIVVTSTIWPPDEAARVYLQTKPQVGVLRIAGGEVIIHRLAPPASLP